VLIAATFIPANNIINPNAGALPICPFSIESNTPNDKSQGKISY
jgi:hypothetical protein